MFDEKSKTMWTGSSAITLQSTKATSKNTKSAKEKQSSRGQAKIAVEIY
jgi:hypothetical protein